MPIEFEVANQDNWVNCANFKPITSIAKLHVAEQLQLKV